MIFILFIYDLKTKYACMVFPNGRAQNRRRIGSKKGLFCSKIYETVFLGKTAPSLFIFKNIGDIMAF